jgi:hypothetical protein
MSFVQPINPKVDFLIAMVHPHAYCSGLFAGTTYLSCCRTAYLACIGKKYNGPGLCPSCKVFSFVLESTSSPHGRRYIH